MNKVYNNDNARRYVHMALSRQIKSMEAAGGGSDSSQNLEDYVKKSDLYLTFECNADNVLNWYDDSAATLDYNDAVAGIWAFPLSKEKFEDALAIKVIVNPISKSFTTRYFKQKEPDRANFEDATGMAKVLWMTGEDYNGSMLMGEAANELPSDFEGIIIEVTLVEEQPGEGGR